MGHGNAFGDSQAQNFQVALDTGGAGTLKIYDAAFANLLATFILPVPSAPAVVSGSKQIVLNTITTVTAIATGTANAYRFTDNAGETIYEQDNQVGVAGSGRQVIVNTTAFVTGGAQSVLSCKISYL